MIFIFGTRFKEIKAKNIQSTCTLCETENNIWMVIYQQYIHIFWIPFFPIGKTGATECQYCRHVLEKKQFNADLIKQYKSVEDTSKTPLWTFSILLLIAAITILVFISAIYKTFENSKIILEPQKNDIYEIKKGENNYTLYKIRNVVGDSVYLKVGQYYVYDSGQLYQLKKAGDDAYHNDEILALTKKELEIMFEQDKIIDIDRK